MSSLGESMAIQAVIFDIDGLMLDSERVSQKSWSQVMKAAGYHLSDEIYLKMIGRTEKDVKHILADAYGADFPFEEMYRQREDRFREMIARDGIPLKPGLIDLLAQVDALGLKKAVASSTYCTLAELKLSSAGIRDYFQVVITGDEVVNGKPAPDLFLAAAKKIGIDPQNCLVLEDSQAGIQAAHAAGMVSILVPDMQPVEDEVSRLAYCQVTSLSEVVPLLEELVLKQVY
jgi:HAD superfamily hydrolase (TIGR01509 family)